MPNYKKHLTAGLITYSVLLYFFKTTKPTLAIATQWLICCLFGSLFPDIDTKSKIQKIFYTILIIIFLILTIHNKMKFLNILSFLGLIPLIVNHRGLLHNIWFIITSSLIILFITNQYLPQQANYIAINIIFFIAGVISHLWLDLGIKKMLKI